MANRTKITPQKKGKFIARLRETANVSASARYCGISRNVIYQYRKEDQEFAEQWDEAVEEAIDALELEARRRAMVGTDKPVFYQGRKCGIIKEYSDTLTIFLLKAHRPDKYRDNAKVEHELTNGGVLLAPLPVSVDEWDQAAIEQQDKLINGHNKN